MSEKWTAGKEAGTVVSNTPNRHRLSDDHVNYYGGYLIAESIPKQEYVNVISRSLAMLDLLEKALPIIEAEADMRDECSDSMGYTPLYHTEMRELADEIEAEIIKAREENHD